MGLFDSTSFLIFLCVVALLYYLLPILLKKDGLQTLILIGAGVSFYAGLDVFYALSLSGCCLINEAFVIVMYRFHTKGNDRAKKAAAGIGIAVNVLILFFFKYSGLFSMLIFGDGELTSFFLGLPLPLGISFYTFHAVSMLADLSGGTEAEEAENGFWKRSAGVFCYLTFFANSVSGPVTKYNDFRPQIRRHFFKEVDLRKIFEYLVLGYFFKLCVANNIQNYTIDLTETDFSGRSPITILVQMFAYSCQIFADFAGYSYIAIGIALLFGYRLPKNFDFPYISKSITEFWKRWHISLSSWLKQYIYFSLGGNRKGKVRTYINLMVVMLVGGIWHGADWKYLLWGALHGLFLVLERMGSHLMTGREKKKENALLSFVRMIVSFTIVSWLWLFFKMNGYGAVLSATKQIFTGWRYMMVIDTTAILMACFYMFPVFAFHAVYLAGRNGKWLKGENWKYFFYGAMLLALLLNRGTSSAFIYFQY